MMALVTRLILKCHRVLAEMLLPMTCLGKTTVVLPVDFQSYMMPVLFSFFRFDPFLTRQKGILETTCKNVKRLFVPGVSLA